MDWKLFHLLQSLSDELAHNGPPDHERIALEYIIRAYALGREAGRAEQTNDENVAPDGYSAWFRPDGGEGGGESGPGCETCSRRILATSN
jgi:hypothetical protein